MTSLLERFPLRPAEIADAVGQTLARLHGGEGPVADGEPLDLGSVHLLEVVAARAARGLVRPERLPHPYRRYSVDDLLGLASHGVSAVSARADAQPVTINGDPRLEYLVVADEHGVRLVPEIVATGLGDRHLDLAIAHQSVHHRLGAEAVLAFYRGYGRDPDLVLLDHYILLSMLLGRSDLAQPDR